MPVATIWEPAMIAALKKGRAEGKSYEACADIIGVDRGVVAKKARELGLNGKCNG